MENLKLEATKDTPEINFDAQQHLIEVRGKSYPENTAEFYSPIFVWMEKYLSQLKDEQVTVNIDIIYFNSSSSKVLLDFFETFENAAGAGRNITVNWFYEEGDEDSLEFGQEFQEDFEALNFNVVQKES
ncbi:MAG: hypothetical protein BWK80_02745 [Desulfobacteraceae bacterium IS3]|nr:MAG: hypothetical protein BWK80_02745 [Desulfobacteraceae bacterium IS3]